MLKKITAVAISIIFFLVALFLQGDPILYIAGRTSGCGTYTRDAHHIVLTDMNIFASFHGEYIVDKKCEGQVFAVKFSEGLFNDKRSKDLIDQIFPDEGPRKREILIDIVADFKKDAFPPDHDGIITVVKIIRHSYGNAKPLEPLEVIDLNAIQNNKK